MQKYIINCVSTILAIALLFISATDIWGQDGRGGNYRQGYGSFDMMGQDPDEILKYGREMMRYGFHETGMTGGNTKYPGYSNYLSDETITKLNAEQEAFIKSTEALRQTIYEKELYLKAELVKKQPKAVIALKFQQIISEARGQFEQKMIEHLIRMKRINFEAQKK